MKLIGYREANFRPDNGKGEEIKGYMIYLGNEIDPRRGGGMEAERQYLTQSKIDREGMHHHHYHRGRHHCYGRGRRCGQRDAGRSRKR